jgi:bifunctional UDP-N-acetylglucosamine pyrophosphorylase/glucosamine-1-phosphate N-acetyltransferase
MATVHAIILAAGEGTRMRSEIPKVLHVLCGRPMIAYAIDLAASAGVKQPIVVLGHGADAVKPRLPKEAKVVAQHKQLGTGDAVLAARKALGSHGDVLILYADTPLLRRTTVQRLIESHFKSNATCTLLTAHLADPSGYGRVTRNETGLVSGVVEESEANAAQRAIREINVGPLVCKVPALLEALATVKPSGAKRELFLTHIVSRLAQREGVKIQTARVEEVSEALGINSRADLARAIGVIRQRIVDTHLHNGVTIEDTHSTFIDHGVSIGADTVLHPYTVIETGVSIGRRCSIGPFARLRSGVSIGDDVRVGNFTELVRTKIGRRVRVNHMTYLGDAVVEEDANIGAGTITANYDGQDKHETHIGKGAFIGSDTVLIAPVKIGAGAVTGAGSVVTKEHHVPDRGIVVGVPARPLGRTDGKAGGPARPLDHRAASGKAAGEDGARKTQAARKKAAAEARAPVRRPAKKRRASRKAAKRPRPRVRARPVKRVRRRARRPIRARARRPTRRVVRAKARRSRKARR